MFQFTFTLDEQDYFRFNEYHAFVSLTSKKAMQAVRLLVPGILLLVWLAKMLFSAQEPIDLLVGGAVYLLCSVLWIVLFKRYYRQMIRLQIRRMKKRSTLPVQVTNTLVFQQQDFLDIAEGSYSTVQYSKLQRVAVTQGDVYFYLNTMHAVILPFHAFQSDKQRADFLLFLQSRIHAPFEYA